MLLDDIATFNEHEEIIRNLSLNVSNKEIKLTLRLIMHHHTEVCMGE
jgi:hypothetical protein